MKIRILILIIAFLIAEVFLFRWYNAMPDFLKLQPTAEFKNTTTKISEKFVKYQSVNALVYGSGSTPIFDHESVTFSDGVWLLRSIDPVGSLSFGGPNQISGTIQGKGTVFIDVTNNILLSIDALVLDEDITKILPSFYIKNNEKIFYDLSDIEKIVGTDLWEMYKNTTLRDEKNIYSGFSDGEIVQNIKRILEREPQHNDPGNIFFKKNLEIRTTLESILSYMESVKWKKTCGDTSESCLRFIMNSLETIQKIDSDVLIGIKEPLIMWGKKNSTIEVNYSWESIFQKYHFDVLSGDKKAVSARDNAIVTMIRTSKNPTYEMWLYLTYILSKEKKGSPYSLQLMTEMIRLGDLLKESQENKVDIVEESNRTLSQLRKVLEETYFDKKDNYLFVLKEDLKDERGQKIDTLIFVNDLNQLIDEIDKSSLFLEYPDFRILRRHLTWFTCIFLKNKEYLSDIRVCRSLLE